MVGSAHDVVVVGGRVAGALTAALLAARGFSVLVLEGRRFPSDTISTHFFRGDGLVRVLDRVGALDEVLRSGAPRLVRELFHAPDHAEAVVNGPQEPGDAGFALSVRRVTLDDVVARHVSAHPLVELRTGVRVVGLLTERGRVVGVRDAAGAEHRAELVVGADGARSSVARWVRPDDVRREPAARVLYYRYVSGWTSPEGDPPDAAEFSWDGHDLAYVFPSDAGRTCVAISIPVDDFEAARHDIGSHFGHTLAGHPGLADRVGSSSATGRVLAGPPLDSFMVQAAGPGWALVGDSGTHQDPWSGMGMDVAARQAEALAQTFGGSSWAVDYCDARDAVTRDRFETTTSGAADLPAFFSGTA